MSIKSVVKKLIPPVIADMRKQMDLEKSLYYFGHYSSWEEAIKESNKIGGDYGDENILDRVDTATQKVRNGEALYEQDSVLFYEEDNNWELLSSLFYAKSMLDKISILDVGGALGSTFFRYRKLIKDIGADWCVVEQKHFVDRGKKSVPEVRFYYSVDEALTFDNRPNVLLLSSLLMYLDDPYSMFKDMLGKGFDYVIIDENAFLPDEKANTEIMLQHVPESIYSATYPAHIFGLDQFRRFIKSCKYEIQWEWVYRGGKIPIKSGRNLIDTVYKGFLLRKKKEGTENGANGLKR